ncbi:MULTISPECIES: serine/threonine-protein kinase [Streptomyces]|uniref:non-specific serine/threonine protein kinase n=1 Tax=Streptomyces dengpaensis TaxID=2049881 RepID=A0ABN5I0U3_9ACTN|nr:MULTISPECIES: serine/threonine-protein kinase [Streptomyces]AVH57004.1 serine/threonine protein kinase [Streptomyces dengpaensis]PIB09093.1 serine/threonine protein kinase [Streptomyces sp. HG99]
MSNNGGAPYGSNEPTSFGLQPPRPGGPGQQPGVPVQQPGAPARQSGAPAQQPGVPYPGNPYASPTQVVPEPTQVVPEQQAQDPGAGRLIGGRYRLLSKLGHGGMGTVWRAKDETVDREVAVKEPRVPDHLPERERANAFERMRREARAAARLDHPGVVNVHDVAVVDGQPWIVMELVQGRSLGDALQEGTLGVRESARVGLEVLGALEAAHAAGILHRDVKPDNVLLGRHDRIVLTDFGIAQIEGETNLTDTGGFVGSPEYIAPERVLGQRPGPASDLWSLGVLLYAATEGVSPFRRSNTPATLQSVLNSTPTPPASASGPLAQVINGLLDKEPSRRPGAAQVRRLLEEAAQPPAQAPTQVVQIAGPGGKGIRVGRKTLIGLGAAVVAAAVAAYLVIADPFAGPLPDGWKTREQKALGATLAVPADYQVGKPDADDLDKNWVTYTDWSGSIWIGLNLAKKSEDTSKQIKDSARAEMYADDGEFKDSGSYNLSMPEGPETTPEGNTTYRGKESAENTVIYTTTDSQNPRPRELKIFYYKSSAGDMYKLSISYPGKGDFTARGREVAKAAIANLDINKL